MLYNTCLEKAFCQYGINGKGKETRNYQDPRNCGKFITCENFEDGTTRDSKVSVQNCPAGLFFNNDLRVCVWPGDYKCFVYQGESCYGTKDSTFGTFEATQNGPVGAIKLYSVSGYVTCNKKKPKYKSTWGCNSKGGRKRINTWITDKKGDSLFPVKDSDKFGNYKLKGFKQNDPFIKLTADPYHTYMVNKGEELSIWYGEDLLDITEHDNDGRHCVDVYVHYEYYFPYFYLNH